MLLVNGNIVNENKIFKGSILIRNGIIEDIFEGDNFSPDILTTEEVIDIDGKITEFKTKLNIRLLYKDAKIKKISFTEFKKLNNGNKW